MSYEQDRHSNHISQSFNEELEQIRTELLTMGGLVERQLSEAVEALVTGDTDKAEQARKSDQGINDMEMMIDEQCTLIIARRQPAAADLRLIYGAPTADQAAAELDAFEKKWAGKYASIAPAWRRAWQEVIPFFAFDPAIRKIIYTTNAIESLNRVIRKSIKTRGSFPTEEAATKLIYLAIRNFEKGGRNVREWFAARNQFAIMFDERFNA